MGEMTRQTREELRHLPLMLVKLLGGIVAVIGFTGWVLRMTRHTEAALPWFLAGVAGAALFLLAARMLAKRRAPSTEAIAPPDNRRMSLMAWGLLLLFAVIFLACSLFATR
uniref:Uncharacterized protein n=1 Tax=Geobacter sp. (strain M21) TaxID=443144 RepID=C6E1E5_GEOSM